MARGHSTHGPESVLAAERGDGLSSGGGAAAPRRSPRLELDDLALRVGDPGVIHAEQLADERLADALEVAQGQIALVELAIAQTLLDDPLDHRPDRRLVAR